MGKTRDSRYRWRDLFLIAGLLYGLLPSPATNGAIIREWWLGIGGRTVADLTSDPRYPNDPDGTELLDLFEGPTNWGNNYGSRLYGWLVAPESGEYTFWIASDDWSELWLSTNEDPANGRFLACVNGATGVREWTKFPSQRSQPIALEAGQMYYIEAIMKERGNRDNIAVAWQPPGGVQEVIPGRYVETSASPPVYASSPSPPNGAMSTERTPVLGWLAGKNAEQHRIYLGDNEAAVGSAVMSTAGVYRGQQRGTTYTSDALEWGRTYYWRIDEVNDAHPESPWRGEVWTFSLPSGPPGYLLITNETLASAFQALVDWRTAEGLAGELITVEDIGRGYAGKDRQEQIRNCIKDHYEHRGTVYVTLGGDDTVVPDRDCYVATSATHVCHDMPTDLYYGGLDGTWDEDGDGIYGEAGQDNADLYPEVWVGRIPVRTTEQATGYIDKLMIYETASPDGFANTMLLAGKTCGPAYSTGTGRAEGYRDHEPVSGGEQLAVNLYRDAIQPFWQATPAHKLLDTISSWDQVSCGDYDLTVEHFSACLNWGYHHVMVYTHGNTGLVGTEGPRFFSSDALALTNRYRPSIMYIQACGTGAFDLAEPCMSEALLRNPDGGAVAYIGSSRTNYGSGNAASFYNELFRNKRRRLGEAFAYHKMSWAEKSDRNSGTGRWLQFAKNLQGDSALLLLREETVRDLHLASPHGCEIIEVGSDLTIRWNASGTDFTPYDRVKLEYSTDSGITWDIVPEAQSREYNGTIFIWRGCPLPAGSHYRIKVSSLTDPSVSDTSRRDFTIAELCLLTVRSVPDANVVVVGCYDGVTTQNLCADYDITIPRGTTVSVAAPWVPEDMPEVVFIQWRDEEGNTWTDLPDYTFPVLRDMTIVAEYGEPVERRYYVNDEIPEHDIGAGDDNNDGRSPARPMRHIQALLAKYPGLGESSVTVSAGVYEENISLSAANTRLQLVGAGRDLTIIDGHQKGSCLSLNGFTEGVISGFTMRNGSGTCGGGIWCVDSSATIWDCAFVENTTEGVGGAIYVDIDSSVEVSESAFSRNSGHTGGAIYNRGTAEIHSCSFQANEAARYGGAIHVQSGSQFTRIVDCTFVGNTSPEYGGGIFGQGSSVCEVKRCVFQNNSSMFGGGLSNFGGTAIIDSCLFEANHVRRDGGAVYHKHECTAMFVNCIFSDNEGGRLGGALTISTEPSDVSVINCTFNGNRANNPGGALCAAGALTATAANCIFWGNIPDQIAGGAAITYCDVQGGWQGQGNIDSDPLFANLASGDFHLKSQRGRWGATGESWVTDNVTSPCIDAGDPDMPIGDEPEPNGGRINMGAYGGTTEASKSP